MSATTTQNDQPAAIPTAATSAHVRPFYWCVMRELWEHRSLYLAPLIAAGVMLVAVILSSTSIVETMQMLAQLDPARQRAAMFGLSSSIWMLLAFTMVVVTALYSLDALHGERRDRSVLFWKSMPVSDLTTVLAKLFTALVVAPAIAFAVAMVTQLLVLLIGSVVVFAGGASPGILWSNLEPVRMTILVLYTLLVLSLWYAPVFAWLLLISSWAKRSTFLWAVLPPVAIVLFEGVAFRTNHFANLLHYRLEDGLGTAFAERRMSSGFAFGDEGPKVEASANFPDDVLQMLTPGDYFSNPWLWVGLLAAAAFTAAAVWMRRYREPI